MIKTAEFVSLGHPDKTADYITSYILDRFIESDSSARYAVEVMLKDNTVVLGGEICSKLQNVPFENMSSRHYAKSAMTKGIPLFGAIRQSISIK